MSQVVFIKSKHGIILAGDTYIQVGMGISFPNYFPKVFHIHGWLIGVCGIAQLQQIVLNALVQIRQGDMKPEDILEFTKSEYKNICSGYMHNGVQKAVAEFKWNPSAVFIGPDGNAKFLHDYSTSHKGELTTELANDILILGPEVHYAKNMADKLALSVPQATSIDQVKSLAGRVLEETAIQFPSSVGAPFIFFKKVGATITVDGDKEAWSKIAAYGEPPVECSVIQWADPERDP